MPSAGSKEAEAVKTALGQKSICGVIEVRRAICLEILNWVRAGQVNIRARLVSRAKCEKRRCARPAHQSLALKGRPPALARAPAIDNIQSEPPRRRAQPLVTSGFSMQDSQLGVNILAQDTVSYCFSNLA
jgi:hypothetical protein